VGAVVAVLIDNVFLIPAFSVAFAMIPFIYVRNIIAIYERQTKEELETALSIITTSYSRDGNIISAVQENLLYIKPPLKESFTAFVGDALAISSSVKQALYKLKGKVDDEIFREWVDTLIQCQDNQEMKDTLQPIVSKLTDVRIVNNELNTMMSAVRTEYYTMVGLVVGNIPLLYVLNKDWFHTLIFETPGKVVLGVCGIVIVVTYFFMLKFTKPVEYKR
jgi:Flp pilus assembly protein TadB